MGKRWWLRGLVLGALACGVAVACASLVRSDDTIVFSHRLHAKEQGTACSECHGDLMKSDRVRPGMLPKEASCLECHEKSPGKCGQCHTNPASPGTWKDRHVSSVVFSHATHQKAMQGRCDGCHPAAAESTKRPERPATHQACMSCHRKDFRSIGCRRCHEDLVENPSRPASLFDHDADFKRRHGGLAKGDEKVCAHCHRPSECAECHSRLRPIGPEKLHSERVDRELVHRGDYLTRHAIEARLDPNRCLKCHATSQCQACHDQRRISARNPKSGSPHPLGWMNPASSGFHGDRARRDVVSCATCHDQGAASNCIPCHKVGGAGGSPHAGGWKPKGEKGQVPCRYCHRN